MPERSRIRRAPAESSSENTAASASSTGPRASSTVTSRPSSRATLVNGVASRPQARKRANASRSQSTLSAKPWCTTQLSARMPSDAILRSSTQTPTCSRSSPAVGIDAERRERVDHDALEVVRVAPQVLAVVAQVEDRVADELAGAVPGRAPAAIGAQHLPAERAVGGLAAGKLGVGVGGAAERQRRRVLAEHDRVGHGALRARRREVELQAVDLRERARPGEQVVDVGGVQVVGHQPRRVRQHGRRQVVGARARVERRDLLGSRAAVDVSIDADRGQRARVPALADHRALPARDRRRRAAGRRRAARARSAGRAASRPTAGAPWCPAAAVTRRPRWTTTPPCSRLCTS